MAPAAAREKERRRERASIGIRRRRRESMREHKEQSSTDNRMGGVVGATNPNVTLTTTIFVSKLEKREAKRKCTPKYPYPGCRVENRKILDRATQAYPHPAFGREISSVPYASRL